MIISQINAQKFWTKVRIAPENECWEWSKSITKRGYGQTSLQGKFLHTHRVAFEIANGPIPKGLYVCHHCDNRKCCRPDHLFLGTQKENVVDRIQKGRSAHPVGEANGNAKLNAVQVNQIRSLLLDGKTIQRIAERYGVQYVTIWRISKNKNWNGIK